MKSWEIIRGDALAVLRMMPSVSAHCVVTSPPYYALRSYKAGAQEMGSEATAEAYLAAQVAVFREVRRVLRDDGQCFVNIGETFADGKMLGIPERLALALQADGWTWRSTVVWHKQSPMPESVASWRWEKHRIKTAPGAIPRRGDPAETGASIGIMLGGGSTPTEERGLATWADCPGCDVCTSNDGLVLRKGSWRPTRAHEYILQMTKGMAYYSDQEAVREQASRPEGHDSRSNYAVGNGRQASFPRNSTDGTRNPRSVQTFGGERMGKIDAYGGPVEDVEHYAAFVVALPIWCIKASTPEGGVCAICGAPWARVVNKPDAKKREVASAAARNANGQPRGTLSPARIDAYPETTTLGWRCTCGHAEVPSVGALVLDPFAGTGTTLVAALRLGRRAVGIELSQKYVSLAESRIRADNPLFNQEVP